MGFLDNIASTVNRGTESAGRAAEKIKLKNQINEVNKRRQQLAAQLGASLYDATKDNPELRSGRETLYAGIASCDRERSQCQSKIDELDAMAQAATAAATTFKCSVCGAAMSGSDLFCSGCGTPVGKASGGSIAGAPSGPVCSNCGASISDDDAFCMSCGAKIEREETAEEQAADEAEPSVNAPASNGIAEHTDNVVAPPASPSIPAPPTPKGGNE